MKIPNNFFNRLRRNDSRKSIASKEFEITKEYLEELFDKQNQCCALTGIKLIFSPQRKSTASLDRIDSSKGYLEGNVWFIHKHVNMMKQSYDLDYFLNMCDRVANYQNRSRYYG